MDETTYDEQLEQLDPELRLRLEAWRAAQTEPVPEEEEAEAELAALMEEPSGGHLHGRASPRDGSRTREKQENSGVGYGHGPEHDVDMDKELTAWDPERVVERRPPRRELDTRIGSALEMTAWGDDEASTGYVTNVNEGKKRTGLIAHRGVVHPDEWVDRAKLVRMLEEELGVSLEVMRDVYGPRAGGPLVARLRELRATLDRKLAEIAAAGGNLEHLARQIGIGEQTLQRGARRGRTPN